MWTMILMSWFEDDSSDDSMILYKDQFFKGTKRIISGTVKESKSLSGIQFRSKWLLWAGSF